MKREFNKFINSLSGKELKLEIKKLYEKFDNVKTYYQLELSSDSEKVVSTFKARIKKEYFPKRGFPQARNSESRKIISEFKKIATHQKDVIELWLFRTEMMINFSLEYEDIDESFYTSLVKGFETACKSIHKEKLSKNYRKICQELVSKAYYIGWDVPSSLQHIYSKHVEQTIL